MPGRFTKTSALHSLLPLLPRGRYSRVSLVCIGRARAALWWLKEESRSAAGATSVPKCGSNDSPRSAKRPRTLMRETRSLGDDWSHSRRMDSSKFVLSGDEELDAAANAVMQVLRGRKGLEDCQHARGVRIDFDPDRVVLLIDGDWPTPRFIPAMVAGYPVYSQCVGGGKPPRPERRILDSDPAER
jgi:hypothetical protein